MTYTLESWVNVSWGGDWRLPLTDESVINLGGGFGWKGPDLKGDCDYEHSYKVVNSEMGHLFYESLGNLGVYDTDGTNPQPGWALQNVGPFTTLSEDAFWSGTEFSSGSNDTWLFRFDSGRQMYDDEVLSVAYALAVRPAEAFIEPVPERATMLLLRSSGIWAEI
jgi:hypothetical protein